jgi:hypothetical protein
MKPTENLELNCMNFSGPEIIHLLQLNESLQRQCVALSEAAKLSDQRAVALESATASAGKLTEHALERVKTLESLLAAANAEVNAQIRARKELTHELRKLQSTICELRKRATINEECERKAKSDLVSLSQRLAAVRARKDTLERESKVLQTATESSVDSNNATTIFTHTPHTTPKNNSNDTITKLEHDILLQHLENQSSTNTILTNRITNLETEKASLMMENEFLKQTKTTTTKDVVVDDYDDDDDDDDDDDNDHIQSPHPMIKKMTSLSSPGSVVVAERSMFYWQSALHQAYSSLILARKELETRDKKIQELEEEIIKYRYRESERRTKS